MDVACGEDYLTSQKIGPPSQKKVGCWLERKSEIPAGGFIFTANKNPLYCFEFRFPDSCTSLLEKSQSEYLLTSLVRGVTLLGK